MRCTRRRFGLLGLLVLGCTSARPRDPSAVHAECPVCRHEGDLACIDVTIDANTPRATFEGRTYYFCSDECRRDFERGPSRYLKAR